MLADPRGVPLRAGTNFLVRAKAFMEAGGSPTYTLTEDFALGMELKKLGWQCRYVQEYLAVGEAPSEIRNCFQQRSRWTKVRRRRGACPALWPQTLTRWDGSRRLAGAGGMMPFSMCF